MVKNKKGDRRERELVNELDDRGWAVMRAPASGSATERELPDVLAGNGEYMYAFEAKASNGDPIYLEGGTDDAEVESLMYFADNFGAYPRIAARFDYEDWRFFNPLQLHETPSGNRRVKIDDLPDGQTFEDIADGPL